MKAYNTQLCNNCQIAISNGDFTWNQVSQWVKASPPLHLPTAEILETK